MWRNYLKQNLQVWCWWDIVFLLHTYLPRNCVSIFFWTGANLEELKEDDDNSIFEKCTQAVQPDTEIDTGTNLQEEECNS